jgi:hypothetical protein
VLDLRTYSAEAAKDVYAHGCDVRSGKVHLVWGVAHGVLARRHSLGRLPRLLRPGHRPPLQHGRRRPGHDHRLAGEAERLQGGHGRGRHHRPPAPLERRQVDALLDGAEGRRQGGRRDRLLGRLELDGHRSGPAHQLPLLRRRGAPRRRRDVGGVRADRPRHRDHRHRPRSRDDRLRERRGRPRRADEPDGTTWTNQGRIVRRQDIRGPGRRRGVDPALLGQRRQVPGGSCRR